MSRSNDTTVEGLKTLSKELDDAGYYSVLLVYHSNEPDHWIKAAHVLDKNQKIKYMPAIRTYSISPEYFNMICRSFNEIQNDRLMINLVSGDLQKDESSIDDVVAISSFVKTHEHRLLYTEEWLEKYFSLKTHDPRVEIIMSGHSQKTLDLSKKYSFKHLSMLDEYLNEHKGYKFRENKNEIVTFAAVIRDSNEEAFKFMNDLNSESAFNWTLYGDKESVKKQIKKIIDMGIKDIMISNHRADNQYRLIHEVVSSILREEINR